MPDATSLHMFYQEFHLYILRVSRSLCCNTRKVVHNPSNFFLVDFVSKFSTLPFFPTSMINLDTKNKLVWE